MSEKKKEVQQYLAEHVNTFIEPMVYDMVKKRPADPVAFSVKWLTEHIGNFINNLSKNKRSQAWIIIRRWLWGIAVRSLETWKKKNTRKDS